MIGFDEFPTMDELNLIYGDKPKKKRKTNAKNTELSVICWLILTPFLLILKDGVALFILAWLGYYLWCSKNNEQLRREEQVKELKRIEKIRKELEKENKK